MDSRGLELILGQSTPELLKQVGYTPEYIQSLYQDHYTFKLVVFSANSNALPATWDNVVSLLMRAYAPGVGKIIENQLNSLKSKSFDEIESEAPTKFAIIHKRGERDPEYITEEKLLMSKGELWKVRSFLYHQLRLTELFSGEGYTRLSAGTRAAPEYITLNGNISELPNVKVIPLN
jgi:hypothetical protein